jgi:hypothetical protein
MAIGSRVFISYSRKDQLFARKLRDSIEAAGETAWTDWIDIPYGSDWWEQITKGIAAANTFVFIISPDSIASEVCNDEIKYAHSQNKRIIPILHREPTTEAPIDEIGKINWIPIRPIDDFSTGIQSLLTTVRTDLAWVEQHTRILVRANEWIANARNNSLLLRGDDLTKAENWLASSQNKPEKPTNNQTEFILASRKISNRNQRRLISAGGIAFIF